MQDAKTRTKAVWGASPAGSIFGKDLRPGTDEFFDATKHARDTYELPWLFDLIPFSSFAAKRVLEIGFGSGYDAYEFCKHHARYVGIDLTPENTRRCAAHLARFGFHPQLMQGDAEHLPFLESSFDVVYSNGVLHHTPDILTSFHEVSRVLHPGGEFWVIVYHKNSVFYWITMGLYDQILRLGFLKRSFRERVSRVEYTTSDQQPLVNVYTRRSLRALLEASNFSVANIWVRKLNREDLPSPPLLRSLWRLIPQRWLDALGSVAGWYLIAKALKA